MLSKEPQSPLSASLFISIYMQQFQRYANLNLQRYHILQMFS